MNTKNTFKLTITAVALGTVGLLLIPLVTMQFSDNVQWSAFDFALMGMLIFTTGLVLRLLLNKAGHLAFRLGSIAAVGTTFLLIWANLAVGLIGAGANLGNLMYMGVVAVVLVGTSLARFKAQGMERAMYAAVVALVVLATVALLAGMQDYPGSSESEIVAVNGFFALLYLVAGLLFRHAVQEEKTAEA
jgi:hypothetical protein